jgi:hypothetical protein
VAGPSNSDFGARGDAWKRQGKDRVAVGHLGWVRQFGIDWQKNFFDHRLHSDESWENKAADIRENSARMGLITHGTPWPSYVEG